MEKCIFSSNDYKKTNKIQEILNASLFETNKKINKNGNYEIYIDEEMYEDAIVQLKICSENSIIETQYDVINNNISEKYSFKDYIELFYKTKYINLLLFSLIYTFVLIGSSILFRIIESGSNIENIVSNNEFIFVIGLLYVISVILSQLIILSARYYETLDSLRHLFTFIFNKGRIGNGSKYLKKCLNAIWCMALHVLFFVYVFYLIVK